MNSIPIFIECIEKKRNRCKRMNKWRFRMRLISKPASEIRSIHCNSTIRRTSNQMKCSRKKKDTQKRRNWMLTWWFNVKLEHFQIINHTTNRAIRWLCFKSFFFLGIIIIVVRKTSWTNIIFTEMLPGFFPVYNDKTTMNHHRLEMKNNNSNNDERNIKI